MTFCDHLYGTKDEPGLVQQLSQRTGIINKLSKQISPDKLKAIVDGIFYSKLSYCLPLFGNIFSLPSYKDNGSRFISFTQKDNRILQTLQNKVNRILTKSPYRTSTEALLKKTGSLLIQQMIAMQTLIMTFKVLKSKKPSYLSDAFVFNDHSYALRNGKNVLKRPGVKLCQRKEGFVYRSITLFNALPEEKRTEDDLPKFKDQMKEWVKETIQYNSNSNPTTKKRVTKEKSDDKNNDDDEFHEAKRSTQKKITSFFNKKLKMKNLISKNKLLANSFLCSNVAILLI